MSDLREGCPFCQAVLGFSVTPVVYESPGAMALFPLNPAANGHTMLIPKTHVTDVSELSDAQAQALLGAVLRVAAAIRGGLRPDGLNMIVSLGAAASQTIDHLHVHLVPRWDADQFGDVWPRPSPALSPQAVNAAARSIRESLAADPGASADP